MPRVRSNEISFEHRRARTPSLPERIVLWIAIALGVETILTFAVWWFRPAHVSSAPLFALLSIAVWYGLSRVALSWYAYLHLRHPPELEAPAGRSAAIFTTSMPGDPFDMVEATLLACREVRYPHSTYLLDDTRDARFAEAARRCGAVPVELLDVPGAKAGKINAALALTTEEFILVLDPDHVPHPGFFDRTLGHFGDPRVGFVQTAQAYYNQRRSFVARGAAEQTYAFYGPLLSGMYGAGTSLAIGANCVFRRAALESIGGHGVGLAEDLLTAIQMHARGWHSVFVPEIVSRGLVPEDLGSFQRQQLKWARGVFEMLFAYYPRAFRGLTWQQRLGYGAVGTYYLAGLATQICLILPFVYLWAGLRPADMYLVDFILYAAPVGLFAVAIFLLAQQWYCDPRTEAGIPWRSTILKIGCGWIYCQALGYAILGVAVQWVPTAKVPVRQSFWRLAWPHVTIVMLVVGTFVATVVSRAAGRHLVRAVFETETVWTMLFFAGMNAVFSAGIIYAAWEASRGGR